MSRHSIFAPTTLLIAAIALFPAISNAQGLTCTQVLELPLSASTVARAQDAVGNAPAALASNEQAKIGILNATPICNGAMAGQDLALFQQIMSLANQFADQATVANELNQTAQAELFETQLSLSLEQAINLAAGR
ncbi:hypothetical protein [Dyella sp. GSA-30]|uniref:hypothetical protein n=1 Tax=Dyella sp. GSA-30 TaxID=2994496 RepID=UPI002492C9DC|nr:hypothetical protein [Dyella sp. GSA-30]BDU22196.1 hypothetical protein DYGSA30_36530 [Dyella sp. GSA-30]